MLGYAVTLVVISIVIPRFSLCSRRREAHG